MKLSEFYYDLPDELIAQKPLEKRDISRLMVLDRERKSAKSQVFKDIVDYMNEGDCLVLNDTRVVCVRLYGKRKTGGKVEIFFLNPGSDKPQALVKPSKRIKEGETIELENGLSLKVLGRSELGRFVDFDCSVEEILKSGHVPLPPYIKREDNTEDAQRYQTVYAKKDGATASPTAGLHFTEELINKIKDKGIKVVYVTLHTSYGTFAPVAVENIEDHKMHSESFEISKNVADIINDVKNAGGKIFSVGTTSTRVLESSACGAGKIEPLKGETNLFLYPGYRFKIVDRLITNFHLPESTLLMLVSAFASRDHIFEAYKRAIEEKYRFFSYGDAMLIV